MSYLNIKRFIVYFLYILFVIYIVLIGSNYIIKLKNISAQIHTPYPSLIFIAVFPIIIGILLALPQFITNFKKDGTWSLDWIKLISIGVPSLYITLMPLLYFSPIEKLVSYIFHAFNNSLIPQMVSGIILGYNTLVAFEKKQKNS
ncbi:hypothetical protein [Pelotomaculum sp. FP]|uniref:hypothetical protein n=1 Tax=Pelotomaculum sp. FP TaxID=261474 RepID=UPI0010668635|nr:hypothetical protein [Pelotomaculum sp. FP]